ncbi:Uncharacterised protein [Serratia fonticola]|uniref:Uncharacterized protein n=1 Tax=Serratia fonticola TaxID=47917 RepID=A0A4V6KQM9_SERFO|nr:Uncharacterised protein [Serratia fonticola]
MKTNDTIALTVRPSPLFGSRENLLLLLLKLRTFIALFLIVGFFAAMVPGLFLLRGSMVIMIKHIAINAFPGAGHYLLSLSPPVSISLSAPRSACAA